MKYDVSSSDFQTTTGTVPPAVETICKHLALGYLYGRTARGGKEGMKRADWFIKLAMDNLNDILTGKAALTDASGAVIETASDDMPVHCNTTDYHPTFNEDSSLNWGVDQDKLDDIDDERN